MAGGKDYSIGYKFTADGKGFQKVIGDINKSLGSVKKNASILGLNAAFDVANKVKEVTRAVIQLAKESFALAAKAEGITAAFERLDRPGLLSTLQKATRGTVDSVTLMQKAIQAKNFKIPLEQLGTYFEFATKRAIQTGESVDYMVNSLITGVGRKSVLVMDNLGISAVELQNEVKKVGDFGLASGNIIRRELQSMGDVADTSATKIERMQTAITESKISFGKLLATSKLVNQTISDFTGTIQNMTLISQRKADDRLTFIERHFWTNREYAAWLIHVDKMQDKLEKLKSYDPVKNNLVLTPLIGGGLLEPKAKPYEFGSEKAAIKTINDLNEELKGYKEELNNIDILDTKTLQTQKLKIKELEDYIKKLSELQEVQEKIKRQSGPSKVTAGGNIAGAMVNAENDKAELAPNMITSMTENLSIAQNAVNELSDTFEAMFINVGGGFKGMIDSMLDSLKLLFAKLAGKAALFGILQALFPGSGMAVGALSGLRSFVGIPGFASGTNFAPGGLSLVGERGPELVNLPRGSQISPNGIAQKLDITIHGVSKGGDIYWSNKRYSEGLNSAT